MPCENETDTRGFCTKYGAHCSFAHGERDLRQPVYESRKKQGVEESERRGKISVIPEDPRCNGKALVW